MKNTNLQNLCEVKREGVMNKAETLHLKFLGRDSWDRPVYMDNEGIIWKDVEPRADREAHLCTAAGNEFDGEPDMDMKQFRKYQNVSVVFMPGRDVW